MYLTDRLPKPSYETEDSPNDISHISLPSISNINKHGSPPSLVYGAVGGALSGASSLSPIPRQYNHPGLKRKVLQGKKKSMHS